MFKENKWLRTDQLISDELSIFEVGYEDVHPRTPYQYEQLDYYLIHFIVQGEGLFFIKNEVHRLSEGDGFLISPYTDNNYYPLVGNPWSYRWIGLRGSGVAKVFHTINLGTENFVYHHDDIPQLNHLFAAVYDNFANEHFYGALGKFYEIINQLTLDAQEHARLEINPEQKYVLAALNIIHHHYQDNDLRINDIADQIKVERTYLYKLFKRYLGISPKEYLLQYQINRATRLLRRSDLSISQIAVQTGFANYSQFSKTFTKYRQMPPSTFRKKFGSDIVTPIKTWLDSEI